MNMVERTGKMVEAVDATPEPGWKRCASFDASTAHTVSFNRKSDGGTKRSTGWPAG